MKKFCALIFGVAFMLMSTCFAANDEVLASTATENDPWSLSLAQIEKDKYAFVVFNSQTNNGAIIPYNHTTYNFYQNGSPFVFMMIIQDDSKDADANLGEWAENLHLIPVYAQFTYENGNVILTSDLYSGQGVEPAQYQTKIQSSQHIKFAEIFLTHMPALHQFVESYGVALP